MNNLVEIILIKYIGILFCYIALIIFCLLLTNRKAFRILINGRNSNEIRTQGILAFSRNTIFFVVDVYTVGMTLIYFNILFH